MMYEIYEDFYEAYLEAKEEADEDLYEVYLEAKEEADKEEA